ncbi:MAG: hypothetical protein EB053_07065 [Chlamydiae bacterium]|nr:hypothetical protein [Chlamydiota bacterium]
MANIPPNGLVRPTPVPQETDPSKTIPKITKVAIDIVSLSSEETNSTIPRATFNAREISSMSKEKTSQVASPYFRPRTTTAAQIATLVDNRYLSDRSLKHQQNNVKKSLVSKKGKFLQILEDQLSF